MGFWCGVTAAWRATARRPARVGASRRRLSTYRFFCLRPLVVGRPGVVGARVQPSAQAGQPSGRLQHSAASPSTDWPPPWQVSPSNLDLFFSSWWPATISSLLRTIPVLQWLYLFWYALSECFFFVLILSDYKCVLIKVLSAVLCSANGVFYCHLCSMIITVLDQLG